MALNLSIQSGYVFTDPDTITPAKLNKMFEEGSVITITGFLEQSDIEPNSLDGTIAKNVGDAPAIGGLPIIFPIAVSGGATANYDITSTHKVKIINAWMIMQANGTAGDLVKITDGSSDITDDVDISGAGIDTDLISFGEIDDATQTIAASGTIRVTQTDGGGSDAPALTVYILAIRVA